MDDALATAPPRPSDLAVRYLVDLLEGHLRTPAAGTHDTLAESLLSARLEDGALRLSRMRAVGDRALFVSGFFGESLTRGLVGPDYYRDIGRAAYGDLSAWLSRRLDEASWGGLYRELAERFADLTLVLATVGDRTRVTGDDDLLALYERWLATGSESVRRRLARQGCVVRPDERRRSWQ